MKNRLKLNERKQVGENRDNVEKRKQKINYQHPQRNKKNVLNLCNKNRVHLKCQRIKKSFRKLKLW